MAHFVGMLIANVVVELGLGATTVGTQRANAGLVVTLVYVTGHIDALYKWFLAKRALVPLSIPVQKHITKYKKNDT